MIFKGNKKTHLQRNDESHFFAKKSSYNSISQQQHKGPVSHLLEREQPRKPATLLSKATSWRTRTSSYRCNSLESQRHFFFQGQWPGGPVPLVLSGATTRRTNATSSFCSIWTLALLNAAQNEDAESHFSSIMGHHVYCY